MKPKRILAVGSVALDTVETPFGKVQDALGGSATFFSASARFFSPVSIVAVIGDDFPAKYLRLIRRLGVNASGLEIQRGKTFRWQGLYDTDLNIAQTLKTELNVFQNFEPKISDENKKISLIKLLKKVDIFLCNDSEARQLSGEFNLIQASKAILSLGPKLLIIKKGEHGVMCFSKHFLFLAPAAGIEPATNRLTGDCSTAELHRNIVL